MDNLVQTGDMKMNVKFSQPHGSWVYNCIFGCFEADFEGEQEAINAFRGHRCLG